MRAHCGGCTRRARSPFPSLSARHDNQMQVIDVRPAQGWLWIKDAWRYFRGAPMGWMTLIGAWIILTFGMWFIPYAGQLAANLLQPVFFAGFMIACRNQDAGKLPAISDVFAAFRIRPASVRALISIGAIMLAGQLIIFLALDAVGFPDLTMTADGKNIDFAAFGAALEDKIWILALGVALTALLKGALWFVPPLLAFHEMSATHAIRWSFYAFLSNFGAVLLYGVLIAAIYALAIIPWGAGLFIVMPLMVISNYTGYKAMFKDEAAAPAAPPSPPPEPPTSPPAP
jgi:uncharacterized membrane protein